MMCQECRQSDEGKRRAAELAEAEAAAMTRGGDPRLAGFLSRYGARYEEKGKPGRLMYSGEQAARLERYNAAQDAMRSLHQDWVQDRMRDATP